MKIGVVTIFNVPNYGAMLQCFSLCTYLQDMGHEVVLFDIPLSNRNSLKYRLKRVLKLKFVKEFISKYFPRITTNLQEMCDLYLVGSDQVWNPDIVGDKIKNFLLDFAPENSYKASYASSIGCNDWLHKDLSTCMANLLSRFNYITVREGSAVELLKKEFNVTSNRVLDPSFLLSSYNLDKLLVKTEPSHELVTFKLVYSYDWYLEARKLSKSMNLRWTELNRRYIRRQNEIKGFNVVSSSVEEWITTIANSKYFITDSFHGCVFALLLKKQFVVVIGLRNRMTRIQSLLNTLSLEHRIVESVEEAQDVFENNVIDYDIVTRKIEELVIESKKHLHNILNLVIDEHSFL